jgi:hypothetical protein
MNMDITEIGSKLEKKNNQLKMTIDSCNHERSETLRMMIIINIKSIFN